MKLNFCPECQAPLHKESASTYHCDNRHPYWNNPSTTVAVVVVNGDKLLVSERGIEPRKGTYDLPGGFVNYGEDVFEAARREMLEETGLEVGDMEIVTAYTLEYIENISVCDLIILARTWSGAPHAQDDSAALTWQPFDFLDDERFSPVYTDLAAKLRDHLKPHGVL